MKSPTRTVQLDPPGRPRRSGRLLLLGPLQIASLNRSRTVAVYLPPGYDPRGTVRYPVTYLFDGQNLFDPYTSFSGDWEVDLTVDRLTLGQEVQPGITVGIYNGEGHRISEQSPWPDAHYGCTGEGDRFIDWVAGPLQEEINHRFLTLTGPLNTGIGGSSMGGLTALYALFSRPDAFGRALVMSPSLWFARGAVFDHVAAVGMRPPGSRVYLDFGGREMRAGPGTRLLRDARIMKELLLSVGFTAGEDLLWVEDPTGIHNEACWAARLPRALSFLWPPVADSR